jgi:hypothetical protein
MGYGSGREQREHSTTNYPSKFALKYTDDLARCKLKFATSYLSTALELNIWKKDHPLCTRGGVAPLAGDTCRVEGNTLFQACIALQVS